MGREEGARTPPSVPNKSTSYELNIFALAIIAYRNENGTQRIGTNNNRTAKGTERTETNDNEAVLETPTKLMFLRLKWNF